MGRERQKEERRDGQVRDLPEYIQVNMRPKAARDRCGLGRHSLKITDYELVNICKGQVKYSIVIFIIHTYTCNHDNKPTKAELVKRVFLVDL